MLNGLVNKLNRRLKENEYLVALEEVSRLELKVVNQAKENPNKAGGGRSISSNLLILLVVNKIIADGVESIPTCWQLIGLIPMAAVLVLIICVSALSVLLMIKSMALIPGNQDLTFRYEYMNVVEHFLSPAQQTVVRFCFIYVLLYSTAEILPLADLFNHLLILPAFNGRRLFAWMVRSAKHTDFSLGTYFYERMNLIERLSMPTYVQALLTQYNSSVHESVGHLSAYICLWGLVIFLSHYNLEQNQSVSIAAFSLSAILWPMVFFISLSKIVILQTWLPMNVPAKVKMYAIEFLSSREARNRAFVKRLAQVLFLTNVRSNVVRSSGNLRGRSLIRSTDAWDTVMRVHNDGVDLSPGHSAWLDLDISQLGMSAVESSNAVRCSELMQVHNASNEGMCSACYSDLCSDQTWELNVLQCPSEQKANVVQAVQQADFLSKHLNSLFRQNPSLPFMVRKKGGWLSVVTVLAKVFTLTEIIPSVSNEVRKEVNITSTCWWAIILSAIVTTLFTLTIATAFPNMYEMHPVTVVLEALLPHAATNAMVLLYNMITEIPSKQGWG